jgi:hypothetical protein
MDSTEPEEKLIPERYKPIVSILTIWLYITINPFSLLFFFEEFLHWYQLIDTWPYYVGLLPGAVVSLLIFVYGLVKRAISIKYNWVSLALVFSMITAVLWVTTTASIILINGAFYHQNISNRESFVQQYIEQRNKRIRRYLVVSSWRPTEEFIEIELDRQLAHTPETGDRARVHTRTGRLGLTWVEGVSILDERGSVRSHSNTGIPPL